MARAVQQAAVVLICFTEKYKDSPNCRTGCLILSAVFSNFTAIALNIVRCQRKYRVVEEHVFFESAKVKVNCSWSESMHRPI